MVGFDRPAPFVEDHEALTSAIVDAAVHRLRHADQVSQQLSSVLVGGGGVPEALDRLAQALGAPTRFIRVGGWAVNGFPRRGRRVARAAGRGAGDGSRRGGRAVADQPHRTGPVARRSRAGTGGTRCRWRSCVTSEPSPPRSRGGATSSASCWSPTLGRLAVRAALREAGLPVDAGDVTVIGSGTVVENVAAALDRACAAASPALSSVTAVAPGSDYAVSVIAVADAASIVVTDVRIALETSMPLDSTHSAAIGPVACRVDDLARSAQEARLSLQAAARAPRHPGGECSRIGLERALLHGYDHDQLQALADEHLGPLLAHHERRGTRLARAPAATSRAWMARPARPPGCTSAGRACISGCRAFAACSPSTSTTRE